jgi:hypothetical protein
MCRKDRAQAQGLSDAVMGKEVHEICKNAPLLFLLLHSFNLSSRKN